MAFWLKHGFALKYLSIYLYCHCNVLIKQILSLLPYGSRSKSIFPPEWNFFSSSFRQGTQKLFCLSIEVPKFFLYTRRKITNGFSWIWFNMSKIDYYEKRYLFIIDIHCSINKLLYSRWDSSRCDNIWPHIQKPFVGHLKAHLGRITNLTHCWNSITVERKGPFLAYNSQNGIKGPQKRLLY